MEHPKPEAEPVAKSEAGPAQLDRLDRVPDRLTPYLILLLLCLSIVGFVDAFATRFRYDMIAYVREDFGESYADMIARFAWVYLGSCLAIVPRMLADVLGRKIMLCVTLVCLSVLQWAVGFTRTPAEFAWLLTVLAVFYKSDIWQLVMSEEAPPRHRGLFTALTVAISCAGILTFAALVRRMGDETDAWRDVAKFPIWGALASILILLFVKETRHFANLKRSRTRLLPSLKVIVAPFRRSLIKPLAIMSALKMLIPGCVIVMMTMMRVEFLKNDHGFDQNTIGKFIQFEVIAIITSWLVAGPLSDSIGRHRSLYLLGLTFCCSLICLVLIPSGSQGVLVAFIAQSFSANGVFAVLRITTFELFPNDCRATASAWTDLFMTMFAALTTWGFSALLRGVSVGAHTVALSLRSAIVVSAVLTVVVLPMFALLKETKGQRLEEVV